MPLNLLNKQCTIRRLSLIVGVMSALVLAVFGCGSSSKADSSPSTKQELGNGIDSTNEGISQCPKRGLRALRDRNRSARTQLAPSGASSVRVCRYIHDGIGLEGRQPGLSERLLRAPVKIRRLKAELSSLPLAREGEFVCPPGEPLNYLVSFSYRKAPEVYVRVSYSGCGFVRNGMSPSIYEPTQKLKTLLNALLAAG